MGKRSIISSAITGKKYTARELAERFGCDTDTVTKHATILFGKGAGRGKTRYFDEAQVTAILEHIKNAVGKGRKIAGSATSENIIGSTETALSLDTKGRMTVREVADVLGVSRQTIYRAMDEAGLSGLSKNGQVTYLSEAQVTAVKMNLRKNSEVAGQPKTDLEKELIIQQALLYQREKIERLQLENLKLAAAYGREVLNHKAAKALLSERETGLEFYQRAAESAGLVTGDREDLLNTYRRVKNA